MDPVNACPSVDGEYGFVSAIAMNDNHMYDMVYAQILHSPTIAGTAVESHPAAVSTQCSTSDCSSPANR